mmetsp:Transcript_90687/g.256794  ORF Transcript_90687/g.256794 Transcript_90687/m.256794 type:complete len:213 (-) Transcript_90687:832-1470(-)
MPAGHVDAHRERVGGRHPQLPLHPNHARENARAGVVAGGRHITVAAPVALQQGLEPARVERPLGVGENHAGDAVLLGLRCVPGTASHRLGQLLQPACGRHGRPQVEEARVDDGAQREVLEVGPRHYHLCARVQLLQQRADLLRGAGALRALPLRQQVRLAQQDHVRELDLVQHQLRDAALVPLVLALDVVAEHVRHVVLGERLQAAQDVEDV